MKKLIILAIILAVASSPLSFAAQPFLKDKASEEELLTFLENTYEVVGRYPEGGPMYSGTVMLTRKENELVMTREIRGKKSIGTARLVAATADKLTVLEAAFAEGNQKYQATYIIGSDLDNYARLSGWTYFKNRETKKPGMEALFILLLPPEK